MLFLAKRWSVVGVLLFIASSFGFSVNCYAHVKWFTEPEVDHFVHSFSRTEIGISISLLLLGIFIAKLLSNYCLQRGGILSAQLTFSRVPLWIFQLLLAIYLIGCSLSGNLLVPHVNATQGIIFFGVTAQVITAVLLLLNRYLEFASVLLCVLFTLVGIAEHSFVAEYILLAGIAWVVFYGHNLPNDFAITILRVTLGISLIALALTEKLLQPELAFNVLAQHPLNFMQHLGFNFSDSWFVLGAGMVELFIGLLFVLGLMVRTTTLVILGLMIASNSYFFWIDNYPLAMMELIGHLPVFAIGVLLLFYYNNNKVSRGYAPGRDEAIVDEIIQVEASYSAK
jgi:uncharacterized membrane protein YphA (DoxX/SURF4 family)